MIKLYDSGFEFDNLDPVVPKEEILSKDVPADSKCDISDYSSMSCYEDDIWILDLYYAKLNIGSSLRKLNFNSIVSIDIKAKIKEHLYITLLNRYSLEELRKRLYTLTMFANYLSSNYSAEAISDINPMHIEYYYHHLMNSNLTQKTIFYRWMTVKAFFVFIENSLIVEKMKLYDVKYPEYIQNDNKYIDEYVVNQLDEVLQKREIPLHYRLLYWLLRLYPSRCTEMLSTPIECLKVYRENTYVFSTKVFKTSGRDENGTPKLLLLDTTEATQNYLHKLIVAQQKAAKKIYKELPELGDFLFLTRKSHYNSLIKNYELDTRYMLLKTASFNRFLASTIKRYNILDEEGNVPIVTSHHLRHNAITDRVESKLFRPIDLRPMTLHANEEMFNKAYYHQSPEEIIKKSEEVRKYITGETVVFAGKVVGSKNDRIFDRFLKNPFAFSLNHMGICADIRSCSKDKLECLSCAYFIPNCDDLSYFESSLLDWKQKYEIACKVKNEYMQENAQYNIILFEKVIKKIVDTVNKGGRVNE